MPIIDCIVCKKSVNRFPSQLRRRTFCSKKCQNSVPMVQLHQHGMWRGGSSKKFCEMCGKLTGDHSSRRCRKCYILTWKDKSLHPNWRGGRPHCIDCGTETCYLRTVKRCRKCNDKWRTGERNPFWKGGVSFLPYPPSFNKSLKTYIKERDRYCCRICGMTELQHSQKFGRKLAVHHIDYNKFNCKPSNLLTACDSCNGKANGSRDYWKAYCRELMKEVK